MTADEDSAATTLAGSPPRVFSNVGVLLWPELWLTWLGEHPDDADLLATAYRCLVRLGSHTGWHEERLLDRLGCDTKSEDQVRQFPEDQMRLCTAYFEWVESLLCELDLASDKRLTVSGAARFFAAAEKDLAQCQAIMRTGPFSPLEYLRLGEIAQSWQCAIRRLPGLRGERARETQAANPFIDDSTPHLSPKRLDMLEQPGSQALFGPRIEQRIHKHLEDCVACNEAFKRRKTGVARGRHGLITAAV
ncbi:MAG TPA: hypothetical protein VMD79_07515 [Solirubrobacteraceae bacterium]|nr:hypothetical protein [Solirubrobacteraceae bacterium]